jgi:hypothetical protein
MRINPFYVSLCLSGLLIHGTVHAQQTASAEAGKTVRVVRVDSVPVIDGKLDESVWEQAEVITDFHQTRPGNGTAPSDPTEVYLLYDDNALYIGARMYDSEPDRIAAPTMRHNQGLGRDDRIVVILDPFHSGRGAYRFETNANGVRHDALYDSVSSFEAAWTAIYESAAYTFDKGWSMEMAIPFKSLSFDPSKDSWGFNFGRGIRRRGEEIAWVSRNRSYNASILGTATGLTGMDQGLGLDIVSSVSLNHQKLYNPSDSDFNVDPSLDVFYRVTPSLNASLTINTDFSATEVDDRQVNLSRFGLFFPEKRDFFLNDSDLFEFGRIGTVGNIATSGASENNGRPFFSRRLGLSRSGKPVDLEAGAKLSGRAGRWNIGLLAMRQDAFEAVDKSNVMVGRLSANVLDESTVGMIMTSGDPNSNLSNAVAGADFRYLNTRFPGGRVLEADAWYQQSDTEGVNGDDAAFGMGIGMPNNSGWRGGIGHKQIQENFKPALGYVNRAGIHSSTADLGYTHFIKGGFFQSVFSGIDAERVETLGGGLQSQILLARLVELETNTRDQLNVHYSATQENVAEPFTIYEDNDGEIIIPVGDYNFGENILSITTATQRDLAGILTVGQGDFYNGDRLNLGAELVWRQSRFLELSLAYERNDINLPQGDFVTHLATLTTEVNFTPTLYWVNLFQYDNVSELVGINARLVWIPTAGQEALIVLNHSLEDRDRNNSFQSELNDVTIKLGYTFRF